MSGEMVIPPIDDVNGTSDASIPPRECVPFVPIDKMLVLVADVAGDMSGEGAK